jgi:hypothetical protein
MGPSRLHNDNHGGELVSDLLGAIQTEMNSDIMVKEHVVGGRKHTTGTDINRDNNRQEAVGTDLLMVDGIHLRAGASNSQVDNETGHRAAGDHRLVLRVGEWGISVHSALHSDTNHTWFRLIRLQLLTMKVCKG